MKQVLYIIASLSYLLLIPTSKVWSLTQTNLTPTPLIANTSKSENIRQIAQSITVKVLVKDTAGSGVIISKEGNNYTVVTNAHVVSRGEPYKIKTPDGKIYDAILKRKEDEKTGNDLAELQFNSEVTYAVAQIGNTANLAENQEVYSAGYPYESEELIFSAGKISLLSEKPLKGGYQIGYTNETVQGMSGGVLLNNEGKLIGILGMGSGAILNEAYTYTDNSRPDAQTLARLRQASFAVPSDRLTDRVADNNSLTPPVDYTGIVAQIDNIARAITVRIDSRNSGNGSGVIVAHQGDTYYVVTANHVVDRSNEKGCQFIDGNGQEEYHIVAPDGERYLVELSKITCFEGADMAVLQFRSQKDYTVAKLGRYNLGLERIDVTKTKEGWIFVSGFPAVTAKNGNPPQRQLTAGRIWSNELADFTAKENYSLFGGQDLVYTALSYKGMSGGPVLDNQGRVIGINTGAENELFSENVELNLGQSLGVPIGTFIGRVTEAKMQLDWLSIETAKPSVVTEADVKTIRTQLFSLKAPSSNGSAYEWLNYCNGLWRSFQFDEAVAACEQAIGKKANFYQAYYLKGLSFYYPKNYQQAIIVFEQATKIEPEFYPAWRWQGSTLYSLKKYTEALSAFEQALKLNKDDLVLYVEKGNVLHDLKRYEEAIATYTEALNIKQHPWAYNNRGLAYRDFKDYQSAIADFNQALSINPENADAYNNRGLAYKDLKDYERAIADFNQALSIDPQYTTAYNNRGIAYYELKDYERAIADFNQAISIDPQDADAYNNRGIAYSDLKDYERAIADFNQALSIDSQYPKAYNNRGLAYRNLKDYERAIADFNQAISIDPQDALAYNNRGVAYKDLKDYQSAIADLDQALSINPENAKAYNNRGLAYKDLKDYERAIADFNQALSIDPQDADAYNNRGIAYSDLKDYERAIADFNQAISIDPQLASAYNNRGIAYSDLKDYERAITDFTQAISIDPQLAGAYINRGNAYNGLKDYERAIADYNQAISIDPQLALAYNNRGSAYKNLKDYGSAIADLDQAISIDPQYPEAYYNRGLAYAQLKDYQSAIADFNQAISIDPQLALAYNNRGLAYYDLKDYQSAIADYTKAISIDPQLALAYAYRGVAYAVLGEYSNALADVNKSAQLFAQQGNQAGYQTAQEFISFIQQEMNK